MNIDKVYNKIDISFFLTKIIMIPEILTVKVDTRSFFSIPRKAKIQSGEVYDNNRIEWDRNFIGYVRWVADAQGEEEGFAISSTPNTGNRYLYGHSFADGKVTMLDRRDLTAFAGYSTGLDVYTRYEGDADPNWLGGEHVMKFTLL
jgi:hypothetical protein